MDAPRTTISLGPFELSIRRNEEGRRVGLPGSVGVHILILALALLISAHTAKTAREKEKVLAQETPIPITFVSPIPEPQVPKPPAPKAPPVDMRKIPPQAANKPLRMQPVPEVTSAPRPKTDAKTHQSSGLHDTRPAGGQAGGPLPQPTTGAPEAQADANPASPLDESKDLQGRLQDFRHALEAPRPPSPKGPKGGGTGLGGIRMPALPQTGYDFGNLQFENSGEYDWEDYGRQIYYVIWAEWHRQLLGTSNLFERWSAERRIALLNHQARVRFTIARSGQVTDVAVEVGSACVPLDDSAANALKAVILPPLPEDYKRDSETIHATFRAEGPIHGMGSYLQQLRDYCTCF
ncbi:MAG TPA: TonB C-terminal domain-containing protein [Candidatus Polarisedimenticolaceae bacterium]|nr:TonB C-terminal domain-containing protein [Candidatus Polarisedimenticolaceae bacterium]